MKLSIIITILNSHVIVDRYIKYFKALELPKDIEIILIDDGSSPPLFINQIFSDGPGIQNLVLISTFDYRPWTQACARNFGTNFARGETLLMTDIDHILSKDAIMASRDSDCDKMFFPRYFAVLDKEGNIVQDMGTLRYYGLRDKFIKRGNLYAGHHVNTFAIKKKIYEELGGYDPRWCGIASGSNHGDKHFYKKYRQYVAKGLGKAPCEGPPIFVFPGMAKASIPNTDPLNLFHNLTRG